MVTRRIISPPPIHGGIASRCSRLPNSAPIPVGPHILWLENAIKSQFQSCTSTAACGTACAASTAANAPTVWALATSSLVGLIVPNTFDAAVNENIFVFSVSNSSNASMSSNPSAVNGTYFNVAPVCSQTICQGTMFAWCSIAVMSTSSPGFRLAPPQLYASRLKPSVAFRTKITSSEEGALIKARTFSRAPS